MMRFVAIVLIATSVTTLATAEAESSQGNAAIQKVIAMLNDMSAKAKQEKNDEEVAFAEFQTWCKTESASLQRSIVKDGEAIELLSTEIGKLGTEAKTLGEEIGTLQALVASSEANKKAQEKQRATEHEAYLEELKDYAESVRALESAIDEIEKENQDKAAKGAVLLQLSTGEGIGAQLPEKARNMVAAFMEVIGGNMLHGEDAADLEAPEAAAYEAHGDGLIENLKKLQSEFGTKKGECEKEEMVVKNAFNMVMADLVDTIENSNEEILEKTALKESKLQRQGTVKGELASTMSSKAEDEKTVSTMKTQCSEKSLSFDEKQKLRAGEIEAIAQAVEILSTPAGASFIDFSAPPQGMSLLQVARSDPASAHDVDVQVRAFIRQQGARLHSEKLVLLAQTMEANPFAKVKKLIDDMITRLLEEANDDAEHEGFCDKEMGESKMTRNKLNEEIDQLTAAIEDGKATTITLTQEIADLEAGIADLQKAMTESTALRTAEKAKNKATVDDSKAAETAVSAALKVLKDFYAKAGQATAFVQISASSKRQTMGAKLFSLSRGIKMGTDDWKALANPNFKGDVGHKEGMQTFGETYQGSDSAGGVLAMLDVILSDFANLQADTTAGESTAQANYEDFMAESKKNVRVKSKKIELDETDKVDTESKLREDVADLKTTQDQLLSAQRYYEKLVPKCIDKGMTFEEKTAAREAEIASLKEALEIISSPDVA